MINSTALKLCVSAIALTVFTACASSAAGEKSAKAGAQETIFEKPSAEEIRRISLTSPLEQAGFWLKQHNFHPTDLDISLAYIRSLMNIKSYEEAAEVAKFTSVSFPNNGDVWTLLGRAYNRLDKPIDALKAYGQVVELNPESAAPLAAMGAIFDSRGDHDTAQMAYVRALKLEPDRPFTLTNYGLSLSLIGKLEQAEEVLKRASELPEANAAVRQNYALILGLQGKFDEARKIAAIDAPDGIAERNTTFLQKMIGENPQLKAIAATAQSTPAPTKADQPASELPKAAPTTPISSSALPDIKIASSDTKPATQDTPQPASIQTASEKTNTSKALALRPRQRSRPSGGEE